MRDRRIWLQGRPDAAFTRRGPCGTKALLAWRLVFQSRSEHELDRELDDPVTLLVSGNAEV
ncbi:MAG: hypothetical protein KGM47_08720, partial [Acidobacteriota bacterium]|nr:hypothetical protein [Acidobacteriota bacterium]